MSKKFFLSKNFQIGFLKGIYKKKILELLKEILNENNQIIRSLGKNYQYSYKKNLFF